MVHISEIFRNFNEVIRGLSASAPWIWYASLFVKPRCRYQPSRANLKISYKIGNWHASPPQRRETPVAGHSFLAAATASGWPNYNLQDIHGPLIHWSELVFPPSRSMRPKRAPRCGPKERVVKYWNKLLTSVVAAASVNVFKKRLKKVWTEVFPHLPHWLNIHLPIYLPPAVRDRTNWRNNSIVKEPVNRWILSTSAFQQE